MKKIIRLTESELTKVIRRTINEMKKDDSPRIAKSKSEWWDLVRQDLSKWNSSNDPDDRMGIQDWIGEVGPNIYGWTAFRDSYGDWDVRSDEDDEDDDYDEYEEY
jgi:hypothetical protein